MFEKIYKYRKILILVLILIVMWGWYFLFYIKREIPIEKYSYYTNSDNQFFIKTKAALESTILDEGYEFINYVDDLTYTNWTYGKNDTGTFVAKAERQFQQEVEGQGLCTFRQKILMNVSLDVNTKLYTIVGEVNSVYKSPKHKNFVEWNVGNCRVGTTYTEEELRKSVVQVDSAGNTLDNFVSGTIKKLRSLFRTKGF